MNHPGLGRQLGIIALIIGYPLLAHYSSTTSIAKRLPALSAAISLAPALICLLCVAWRSPKRRMMPVVWLAAGAALWCFWPTLNRNVQWIYFLQNSGTDIFLASVFAYTLGQGREPLVSRLARSAHGGTLSPAESRYTRQVTVAWTLFFVGLLAVSALLFFFASFQAWSVFGNLLTLPLVLLMFAMEFRVRVRLLPNEKHDPFSGLRAYWTTARTVAVPAKGR